MGLLEFNKLPINTLVGADWDTFRKVTAGQQIDPRFKGKYRLTTAVGRLLSSLKPLEDSRYKKLADKPLEMDPLFILGHWRSGTTFVHNVFACDKHFGFTTTYQTVFPHLMLWGQPFFKKNMAFLMPDKRPTDNMELQVDLPQEEEFALSNMTACSYYHFWSYPKHTAELRRKFLVMKDCTPEEMEEFKREQKKLIDLALAVSGKKQFLSKNPPHTGRVKELLEMYPDAKFIFLIRNPYTVYKSTMSFVWNTIQSTKLQDITREELEAEVMESYKAIYDKYEEDKHLIPEGHLFELRFEDFEKDPVGMAEKIYKSLNLGDFESVRPLMAEYAVQKKGFRKNKYEYDEKTLAAVDAHWHKAVEQWGYRI